MENILVRTINEPSSSEGENNGTKRINKPLSGQKSKTKDTSGNQEQEHHELKKRYRNISNDVRSELIEAVQLYGEKIKHAAKRLQINYSSAKSICQVFKKEGRTNKKCGKKKDTGENKEIKKSIDSIANSEEKSQNLLPKQRTDLSNQREFHEEELEYMKPKKQQQDPLSRGYPLCKNSIQIVSELQQKDPTDLKTCSNSTICSNNIILIHSTPWNQGVILTHINQVPSTYLNLDNTVHRISSNNLSVSSIPSPAESKDIYCRNTHDIKLEYPTNVVSFQQSPNDALSIKLLNSMSANVFQQKMFQPIIYLLPGSSQKIHYSSQTTPSNSDIKATISDIVKAEADEDNKDKNCFIHSGGRSCFNLVKKPCVGTPKFDLN